MTTTRRTQASTALLAYAVLLLVIAGCGGEKKMEPVKVGDMDFYRDPGFGYSIQYPKGWIVNAEVGRAGFYSAQDVDKKFLDPTGQFPDGVAIAVSVIRSAGIDTARKIMDDMSKSGFVVAKPDSVTLGGKTGVRYAYTGMYTKTIKETGQHIYVPTDTVVYDIKTAGFGGYYDAYKQVFDASLASIQFPKPVAPGRDATLPSETFTEFQGKLFAIQAPDNYNQVPVQKGSNDEVMELRGQRQDCSIRIDVFGAKGLTVEKVFDQNRKGYRGASEGKATVAGLPAMTLTYAPTSSVERRFYFAVKNDKVFRVTMDWYRPQREEYLKAYEKAIGSLKIK
ncbi:MAG TPA: hypothetical protein VL221_14435 [Bacteroidota bacterium]|nr:hypothetical protein [Bacteroidota bacterium]